MKILRGTIFGGIAFFFLGWVVYGMLLADFMAAHSDASLNRPDDQMIWWAMILSNLVLGLLVTLVLKWSGATSIADGIKTGAIFGFLMGLTMDLMMYSMTTQYDLTVVFVDVIVYTILLAIIGLVIVLTWGKGK
ncbi:DUF1761 family protein [Maribellus maritimus]|uniref:DUF1761 family protein n=1 Tax=Maribellus maritimus TaxID=2870838 RepID=UPI001EEBE243|nr:DUF1761 family protein [Maribellus maritimus]MCG6190718.1 DUF1761 family protein [Maribellus maritimus]